MLSEVFGGRNPSHYKSTSIIKTVILGESIIWAANNFILPIFSVFVATEITHGNVEIAGSAFSIYLIGRIASTLVTGEYLKKSSDFKKLLLIVIGYILVSACYVGFSYSHTVLDIYLYNVLLGISFGIAAPPRNTIFAQHIDASKATFEYSIYDASVFICQALAAALGGFIAHQYGFRVLFLTAAIVNFIGVLLYLFFTLRTNQVRS